MKRAAYILGLLTLMIPGGAYAADTDLAYAVQLRAAPADEYPAVRRLAKGLSVEIHGCLTTVEWCDISWRGNRGWVQMDALGYPSALRAPKVSFNLETYWDANYDRQLWYADRSDWYRRSLRQQISER